MKTSFKPRAPRPAAPGPIVARVTPAPAPTTEPPPAAIELPPLPLAGERDKPLWPRTEDEIDLPSFLPTVPPAVDLSGTLPMAHWLRHRFVGPTAPASRR